jgi:hypothetical protein
MKALSFLLFYYANKFSKNKKSVSVRNLHATTASVAETIKLKVLFYFTFILFLQYWNLNSRPTP